MKILYVVHSFPPQHWRGSEVYAMELATAMSAAHETHVFYLRPDPQAPAVGLEVDEFRGIPVHRARMVIDPARTEDYFFHPEQEARFRELLARLRPDVVHFIYFAGGLSLGLPLAARESGAKMVITTTDFSGLCPRAQLLDREGRACAGPREGLRCLGCLFDEPLWPGHSRLSRLMAERLPPAIVPDRSRPRLALLRRRLRAVRSAFGAAALVLYPNENTARRYREAGIGAGRELVLDYGIDLTRFARHQKSAAAAPRIGFIGQLLPHKGLRLLAEALSCLPEAGTLICYGSLDDPGAADYVRSLGTYRDRIDFRGTFAFEKMNEVLEGIDVLVVPSQWQENCPLIVKYALATRTWTLLADQPGMVARRGGLSRVCFFDPSDAGLLRQALLAVLAELRDERSPGAAPSSEPADQPVIDINDQARTLAELYERI
jgi:glycosyltransferase involved in cell wall biosynthesis